jgi:hypothetical protein
MADATFSTLHAVDAEDARIGLVTCEACGATITLDQEINRLEQHVEWHRALEARIAANRPDPRLGFIGG